MRTTPKPCYVPRWEIVCWRHRLTVCLAKGTTVWWLGWKQSGVGLGDYCSDIRRLLSFYSRHMPAADVAAHSSNGSLHFGDSGKLLCALRSHFKTVMPHYGATESFPLNNKRLSINFHSSLCHIEHKGWANYFLVTDLSHFNKSKPRFYFCVFFSPFHPSKQQSKRRLF